MSTYDFWILGIAGGGGGGGGANWNSRCGGGGGAGEFFEDESYPLGVGSYSITIGNPGTGGTSSFTPASNFFGIVGGDGGNSSFDTLITLIGGGGGGRGAPTLADGRNGGSGGGGGSNATGSGGGGNSVASDGVGNNGGNSWGSSTTGASGGGGGANSIGGDGAPNLGGNGGSRVFSSISGSSVGYGHGGGGTSVIGSGTDSGSIANRGDGGRGGRFDVHGANGSSGVFIIRYKTGRINASGGTITTHDGDTIHTFNSSGTFTVTEIFPEVIISTISGQSIASTIIRSTGSIDLIDEKNVIKRGFVYSTSTHGAPGNISPEDSDYEDFVSETGTFSEGIFELDITGLTASTEYFIRAFSEDDEGNFYYGDEIDLFTIDFETLALNTINASDVDFTEALLNGNIISDGEEDVTRRGFVYDTEPRANPIDLDPSSSGYQFVIDESGIFSDGVYSLLLTGLTPDTEYFFRAFAENQDGFAYGNQLSFITKKAGLVYKYYVNGKNSINTVNQESNNEEIFTPIKYFTTMSTIKSIKIIGIPSETSSGNTVVTLRFYANQNDEPFMTKNITDIDIEKGYIDIDINKHYAHSFQMGILYPENHILGDSDFRPSIAELVVVPTRGKG